MPCNCPRKKLQPDQERKVARTRTGQYSKGGYVEEKSVDTNPYGNYYFALNLDFHDRISEAAHATRTRDLYVSLGKEVQLLRWHGLRGKQTLTASNEEHRRIVAAIEARDSEAARREGATHHLNGKRRWLEKL